MNNLVKPSVYAKEQGISRQAVYAKIKKGALPSKEVDGQIFVDIGAQYSSTQEDGIQMGQPSTRQVPHGSLHAEYRTVLASKNETIETLKSRIEDLKESNEQMTSVLRGEIDLLKQAFNEMKSIYANQLLTATGQKNIEILPEVLSNSMSSIDHMDDYREWISIDKYLATFNINPKYYKQISDYVDAIYKSGDPRAKFIDGVVKLDVRSADLDFAREALK